MQHLTSMHQSAHLISQREVWRLLANLHGGSDAKVHKARALSAERGTRWPLQLPQWQRAHMHAAANSLLVWCLVSLLLQTTNQDLFQFLGTATTTWSVAFLLTAYFEGPRRPVLSQCWGTYDQAMHVLSPTSKKHKLG